MSQSWTLRGAASLLALLSSLAFAAERGYFGFSVTVDADGIFNPTLRSIKIDQVSPGSPAAKAGLAAGDSILEVQGLVVSGAKGDELKAAMQKSAGEMLRLKIRHANADPVEVSMTATTKP